jgi:hypothetical protein
MADLCFQCPGCQEEVEVVAELAGQLVRCPYCNTDFFASVEQSHLPVVNDTADATAELDRESAFDKLRIENCTALRMGAIRARSWWLIALCMTLLVALDMLGRTAIFIWVFHRLDAVQCLRIALTIGTLYFARHAWRRARAFKLEIEQSAIPEPTTPPDFSTLGNGSERWKHLENVR